MRVSEAVQCMLRGDAGSDTQCHLTRLTAPPGFRRPNKRDLPRPWHSYCPRARSSHSSMPATSSASVAATSPPLTSRCSFSTPSWRWPSKAFVRQERVRERRL